MTGPRLQNCLVLKLRFGEPSLLVQRHGRLQSTYAIRRLVHGSLCRFGRSGENHKNPGLSPGAPAVTPCVREVSVYVGMIMPT